MKKKTQKENVELKEQDNSVQNSQERDIAIQVTNVKKQYKLGTIGGGTLVGDIQSWWARIRGKEDPNSKIGAKKHVKNEKFLALDGVSLTIYKGERVGIIGHNGAGKSTLLKLLAHVTAPTEGRICIDGRISSMLEVGTGFNGELTGRENIYLNGAILGMSKAEIDSKIDEIIEFSECAQFIDTPVKRYSSGMFIKLGFAVAAHLDSEILVMDEVLAVGDMKFQTKCLGKMNSASQEEGRTVLYVSHNMGTIRQLCERCIVLDHGKVVFDGDVETAIDIYCGLVPVSNKIVDCTNLNRTVSCLGDVRIISVENIEKPVWRISVGECLKFKLKYKSSKDMNNLSFRMRLCCLDNTSVSVLVAKEILSCKQGIEEEISLMADVSAVVPGRYFLTVTIYSVSDVGTTIFHDHIGNAISFEIINIEGFNDNIEWDSTWWGNIKLPDIIELSK